MRDRLSRPSQAACCRHLCPRLPPSAPRGPQTSRRHIPSTGPPAGGRCRRTIHGRKLETKSFGLRGLRRPPRRRTESRSFWTTLFPTNVWSMAVITPSRSTRYVASLVAASVAVALWVPGASGSAALRGLVSVVVVVVAVRALRVGVQVTKKTVIYRGYMWTKRVARQQVRRVSTFPSLLWEAPYGRTRQTPMLCFSRTTRFPAQVDRGGDDPIRQRRRALRPHTAPRANPELTARKHRRLIGCCRGAGPPSLRNQPNPPDASLALGPTRHGPRAVPHGRSTDERDRRRPTNTSAVCCGRD